jgi:hypothetical protein
VRVFLRLARDCGGVAANGLQWCLRAGGLRRAHGVVCVGGRALQRGGRFPSGIAAGFALFAAWFAEAGGLRRRWQHWWRGLWRCLEARRCLWAEARAVAVYSTNLIVTITLVVVLGFEISIGVAVWNSG